MARDPEFTVGVVWELTAPLLLLLACRDDIEAASARWKEEPDRDENPAAWFAWANRLLVDAGGAERKMRRDASRQNLAFIVALFVLGASMLAGIIIAAFVSCPECKSAAPPAAISYDPGDEVMDTAWPVENAGSAGGMGYGR